jgi:predicted amidohydrolase
LNLAVAFGPDGREVVRYDKIHPFTLGEEAMHYTAGEGLRYFEWGGMTVCPQVCYDLRFPETFRRAVGERRPQLFAVIANWPSYREHHWTTLLSARAIENQAYVIGVNRAGRDPKHPYPGRTMIVDPHGKVVADGGVGEGVVEAEVGVDVVEDWRREFPVLGDMKE